MPYTIREKGDKWEVVNRDTEEVKATHDTKEDAERQVRLLEGLEHGWEPTEGGEHSHPHTHPHEGHDHGE